MDKNVRKGALPNSLARLIVGRADPSAPWPMAKTGNFSPNTSQPARNADSPERGHLARLGRSNRVSGQDARAPAAGLGSHGGHWVRWWGTGSLLFLGLVTVAQGQEAVRMSMAGDAAAAAQRQAASTIGYYNLELGPTAWNFGAGLGVDYNSNVNYSENNPEGDFRFIPQMNTRMLWPVTDRNSINLTLGVGYLAYLQHQELDWLFLTPGSGLSFDLYVKDFQINLHDRFSMQEYSYQNSTSGSTGNYSVLQNALGTTVLWDLNKVVLKFGYDHVNYVTLASRSGQPSAVSEVASLAAGYAPKAGTLAGLELGGDLVDYAGDNLYYRNAKQWNVGGFYDTPVSEYIHLTAHAGYMVYSPEPGLGLTYYGTDTSGIYAQLDVSHRLNDYVSYTLSGGRMINLGYASGTANQYSANYGGTVDEYYAHLTVNWKILRKVTLRTNLGYNHGTQLSGYPETWDQYGFGISLVRSITSKLSASLGDQFYLRQSDRPGRSYDLNVVSLSLYYRF